MRLTIGSDIHGSALWAQKLVERFYADKSDKLVLLGDILYHGPRNALPEGYDPKAVIELLNPLADRIVCVRGNCEAEVDQMVLNFPCMADYNVLYDEATGKTLFLTHGHIWGPGLHNSVDRWPNLPQNSAFLYGHTHKKVLEELTGHPGVTVFNPGSTSIPKDGSHSCGLYNNGVFEHVILG